MPMTEFMDPTAAKIILSAQYGDSIHRVAEKVGISYSWVYDWVKRLEEENIIANTDNGIEMVDHGLRRSYDDMMSALYRRDELSQDDAYVVPHFAGMEFAFTEIDAAFVWTNGGYQIARSHDDYPIFIAVHDQDVERWVEFFDRYGIHSTIGERPLADTVDGNIHYVLFPTTDGIDPAWVDGHPVIPLEETVEQLLENRAAYEPALEILAEKHDIDIDANHHEYSTEAPDS